MTGIGSLNEKPLHASLKEWCARPGDRLEERVDGFVIDIVRDGLLLEIQTKSFASIKTKLHTLVRTHRVRLVYPVAVEKWIVKPRRGVSVDGRADEVTRRKSPRKGRVEDVFREMVSLPHVLRNPNFSLEVLFIKEEEVRRYDGKRGWRTRGWVIESRRLLGVVGRRLFERPEDWQALLAGMPEGPFTAGDLSEALGIRKPLAGRMAYCLCRAEVIRPAGKRGRALVYEVPGRDNLAP